LLIDDGIKARTNRKNVLNPEFGVMGCYSGEHQDFIQMSCINYAGAFIEDKN